MFFYSAGSGSPPEVSLRVAGVEVGLGPTLKYLGLTLDGRWCFVPHFRVLTPKVDKMAGFLARLLPNMGGPSVAVRRLYVAVIHSMLLYGSPIWAGELARSSLIKRMVHGPQRRMAARVVRAYRTVSFGAVTALAGIPPAECLAEMYAYVYYRCRVLRNARKRVTPQRMSQIRAEARERALANWPENIGRTGGQTGTRTLEALRPVLRGWVDRGHGYLDFRLTQILSGHGCFEAYLHKIGKRASDECHHCEGNRDTAQHTLQSCPAWSVQRAELCRRIGEDLSLPEVVRRMLSNEQGWRAVSAFANEVMGLKEEAERERERLPRAATPQGAGGIDPGGANNGAGVTPPECTTGPA